MNYISKKDSIKDIASKYIFDFHGEKVEYVYVDNYTGKDIVCVPSQTGCKMGCMFCYLTHGPMRKARVVTPNFSVEAIKTVLAEKRNTSNKTVLISFMGMGEPLLSFPNVLETMHQLKDDNDWEADTIRAGLATIVPSLDLLREFTENVRQTDLNIKLHWSLHSTDVQHRLVAMPKAEQNIDLVAINLDTYRKETGNKVEVHYTIFKGNDSNEDADNLSKLLLRYNFPVKFLKFSMLDPNIVDATNREAEFISRVYYNGVSYEVYTPPGADINGCCGQFEIE